MSKQRNWVDVASAAKDVGVHPITLRRWIAAGRIAAYRAGPRLLRVDLNEVNATIGARPVGEALTEEQRTRRAVAGELAAAGYAHAAKFVLESEGSHD